MVFTEGPSSPSSTSYTRDMFDSVAWYFNHIPSNGLMGILEDGIWEDSENEFNHVLGVLCSWVLTVYNILTA